MRTTPDHTFTAALRTELAARVVADTVNPATRPQPASAAHRSWMVSLAATVGVLAIIAAVTVGLTHLPAPAGGPNGTTSPTRVHCTSGQAFAPFPCNTFQAVKGAENAEPLAWLPAAKVTMRFRYLNGHPSLLVSTPCNALSIRVRVSSRELVPIDTGSTLMLCEGSRGSEERWVGAFFSHPVGFTYYDHVLLLSSPSARLTLRSLPDPADAPPPAPVTAWDPALAAPARTYTSTTDALPACDPAQLTSWGAGDGGGAGGTFYQAVYVKNTGPDCSLAEAHLAVTLGDNRAHAALGITGNGFPILPTDVSEQLDITRADGGCLGDTKAERLDEHLTITGRTRDLHVTFPWTSACPDLGFDTWGPAPAAAFTGKGYTSSLPNLDVTIKAPDLGQFTGGTLHYTVTLTNTGATPYAPHACPRFVQVESGARHLTAQRATLDCTASGGIAAHKSATFAMAITAPADPNYFTTAWYLDNGNGA